MFFINLWLNLGKLLIGGKYSNKFYKHLSLHISLVLTQKDIHTATARSLAVLLLKHYKKHPTLAKTVSKCYQDLLFTRNILFNIPTSVPQT